MSLTSDCAVHSNVYGLGNIHWIKYLAVVDPILSTSSAVQTYHHVTSGSVKIPLAIIAWNFSSIWKKTISYRRPISTSKKRRLATSSKASPAEQGIIIFSNVLQGHKTVVLVCCISEWEPDITCTWRKCMSSWQNNVLINEVYCVPLMSMFIILCSLGTVPWSVQDVGGQTLAPPQ